MKNLRSILASEGLTAAVKFRRVNHYPKGGLIGYFTSDLFHLIQMMGDPTVVPHSDYSLVWNIELNGMDGSIYVWWRALAQSKDPDEMISDNLHSDMEWHVGSEFPDFLRQVGLFLNVRTKPSAGNRKWS